MPTCFRDCLGRLRCSRSAWRAGVASSSLCKTARLVSSCSISSVMLNSMHVARRCSNKKTCCSFDVYLRNRRVSRRKPRFCPRLLEARSSIGHPPSSNNSASCTSGILPRLSDSHLRAYPRLTVCTLCFVSPCSSAPPCTIYMHRAIYYQASVSNHTYL